MFTDFDTEVETLEEVITEAVDIHNIVLYNDDVNTFEFVIESLVDLCDHEPIQAEQCAHIVHFKGKCGVKKGDFDTLKPICEELLRRGLSSKIE